MTADTRLDLAGRRICVAGHKGMVGSTITRRLAGEGCEVVGFAGGIERDTSKPDGTPRKLMSGEKLPAMGWAPRIGLRDGIARAYRSFLEARVKELAG